MRHKEKKVKIHEPGTFIKEKILKKFARLIFRSHNIILIKTFVFKIRQNAFVFKEKPVRSDD
jgi:hypothetical protein